MTEDDTTPAAERAAPAWRWIRQAARSIAFLRVDWRGLRATPLLVTGLIVAALLAVIVGERVSIPGHATFYWPALGYGWAWSVVTALGCWGLVRQRAVADASANEARDAPTLFALLLAQILVFDAVAACTWLPLYGLGILGTPHTGEVRWLAWAAVPCWFAAAQVRLAWLAVPSVDARPRAGLGALLVLAYVTTAMVMPFGHWQVDDAVAAKAARPAGSAPAGVVASGASAVDADADDEPEPPMLQLSQQVFEAQQRLLASQLDAVAPGRPGVVDLYAITFAPFADQDVFMRESQVVADTMDSRFDARGHTLQLVNNLATLDRFAWATPLNLKRGIDRMAARMNRDEDILFIHLTSHGGRNAHLAAEFFPLTVDELTPAMLRTWLDAAGVKHRVISISACFSGSWVEPLAGDDTLVMTAADATHTSYGCGSKSTLTFFGQAMYAEQLRQTWSFEQAHAAARKLIDEREKQAGKEDGYSNPQIRVGAGIRGPLKALEARLAASAARTAP